MDKLIEYLQFDFVRYAIISGVFISLCSALIGSVIVTKKMSFIGDGLSHISFGATIIAMVSGISNNLLITLPITFIMSLFLFKNKEDSKLPNDAILAMFSVFGLAFGYMFINLFGKTANVSGDVCGFLFGSTSILTLNLTKVVTCVIISVICIGAFILFYNKIYATTFDEAFSKASGTKIRKYNILTVLLIDTIIVLSTQLVGALLVSALIVLPTLSAIRVSIGFKGVIVIGSIISVIGALIGIGISIVLGTPVGCTIVMADMSAFIICSLLSYVINRK